MRRVSNVGERYEYENVAVEKLLCAQNAQLWEYVGLTLLFHELFDIKMCSLEYRNHDSK